MALQDLSLSLSVMSWVAALCLALAYVITLWLLPDIKVLHIALIVILESLKDHIQEPQVGQMEEYFRILFDRSKNVRLTSSAAVTDI